MYSEADYEESVIQLFKDMGYHHVKGSDIEIDMHSPLYEEEIKKSLYRINPLVSKSAVQEAIKKIKDIEKNTLIQQNEVFTRYIQEGIPVQYMQDNEVAYTIVYLVDYTKPENNSFIIGNQWTIIENSKKRPDIILFINGLPLVLMELKSPIQEKASILSAYRQIKNYEKDIPSLFIYNAICVISDFLVSKAGTITSTEDRFMEWKTSEDKDNHMQHAQWDIFCREIFKKERLLDIIKNFICFMYADGRPKYKILAGYHQYFAVKKAVQATKRAIEPTANHKAGVVWHTQGSGKSLSMVFYTHLLQQEVESATVVVITDRNDLDNQLFNQFVKCEQFLRQTPQQAESRIHLQTLLSRTKAHGIIFTTMQKFIDGKEALSQRENIIVIADEAHRGQYNLVEEIKENGKIKRGLARIIRNNLPNATYIGFTGTPISLQDRDTQAVFGEYIDRYDMTQAVKDGATRPIYYENRIVKLGLNDETLDCIDKEYDILEEQSGEAIIHQSQKALGKIDVLLGQEPIINALVMDIISHYEQYRHGIVRGKAMIVAYSRQVAIQIFHTIRRLRPEWEEKVAIIVTSSNNDPVEWKEIIKDKKYRDETAVKFKEHDSALKIVIVVDMWLTGFDVPSLDTMYIFKFMSGHNLMQAIARVNRVFEEKEGGLIVDYIGIAKKIKEAMCEYTSRDRENYSDTDIRKTIYPQFLETLEQCRDCLYGYDYTSFNTKTPFERSQILRGAINFLLDIKKEKERERFMKEAYALNQLLSLCVSLVEEEQRIESSFMNYIRVALSKLISIGTNNKKISLKEINEKINELIKWSVTSEGVINLFSEMPHQISLFDISSLEEVAKLKEKNIAVEILKGLVKDKTKEYRRSNIVKSEKFSERLKKILDKYINNMMTNEQVIEELLALAKQICREHEKGKELGLTQEEIAFYDALTKPQAVRDFYSNEELIALTKELTQVLHNNKTIDWQKRQSARATMRMSVKKLLKKYKYPPVEEEGAVDIVVEQCELWTDNIMEI